MKVPGAEAPWSCLANEKGRVQGISERWVAEGHFGSFSVPGYRQAASKSEEMALNFDLAEIGRRFGIEEFV